MACRCAPSLIDLRDLVTAQYPHRDKSSDGCCGDAAHAARKSDHNPDGTGYAHAYDIDEDIATGWGPKPLWAFGIALLTDPRVKYLIYERRILYPDGTDKPYTGVNAHEHHLHVSIKPGTEHDQRPWPRIPARGEEDDMLSPEAQAFIKAELAASEARIETKILEQLATGPDSTGKPRGPIGAVVAKVDQRTGEAKAALARIEAKP